MSTNTWKSSSRLLEVLWYVLATANMGLAIWSFFEVGSATSTILLWVVFSLGSAQMVRLNRKFDDLLTATDRCLSDLQAMSRKVSG